MKTYDTVTEAVNDLNKRGYTVNFGAAEGCLVCNDKSISLSPEEFEIDEVHRFEGATDPADETVVYAIASKNHNIKGVLVNAYGPYADSVSNKLIEKLKIHRMNKY